MDLPPVPPGGPVRPELSDVGKLGRRLLRAAVSAARAEDAPTLPRLLAGLPGGIPGGMTIGSVTMASRPAGPGGATPVRPVRHLPRQ